MINIQFYPFIRSIVRVTRLSHHITNSPLSAIGRLFGTEPKNEAIDDKWQRFRLGAKIGSIGFSAMLLSIAVATSPARSQSNPDPLTTEICEVDLNLLKSNNLDLDPNIVTANTVSARGMTVPSLWWTNEQFPSKLVTNWIANRNQKRIYLLVNTKYWNLLDYIDRYRTIDKFGTVARGYGYNLKVCNSQKVVLARYTCEQIDAHTIDRGVGEAMPPERDRSSCQIWLNTIGQNGFGVQTK